MSVVEWAVKLKAKEYLARNLVRHLMAFLSLLACIPFQAESTPQTKRAFLIETQLKEREVEQVSGPDSCQGGELEVLDLNDQLTLMLGAHALAVNIGKEGVVTTKEKACTFEESTEVERLRIVYTQKQVCTAPPSLKGTVTRKVIVDALDDGFRYRREVRSDDGTIKEENCRYKYVKE